MSAAPSAADSGVARRWYVLLVLTLVYALSIADRFVMSTLIEPIKADLGLSDSSIGFLTGSSLAFFYVTAGLPLATLADRANRRTMIALALGAWSVMTTLCGFAQNYWQLLLARIGVGVGEAGGTPPSASLLSDYFTPRRRALALSVYSVGASLGSMMGSSAGYASDAWGWRAAFYVLGVPGVLVAVLVAVTIREPERGRLDAAPAHPPAAAPAPAPAPRLAPARATLKDTLRFARVQPALLHTWLGATVYTLWSWGLMWWTPSFLVRSHHMSLGDAGGALSLMHGIGGTAVLLITMLVMGPLGKRDPRLVPWFVAATIVIGTVPSILAYSVASSHTALVMLWIFIPLSYAPFGPTFALLQNLVPASMRAQAVAVMLFCANIANLVIAPQAVGFASDLSAAAVRRRVAAPRAGADGVRGLLGGVALLAVREVFALRRRRSPGAIGPSSLTSFSVFLSLQVARASDNSRMKTHARVAVIGGGVVGASVLYHLTKLGWRDVVLLERSELTAGSTWHAAGGVHTLNGDSNVAALQAYTIDLYREIEQVSGVSCGLHRTGCIYLAVTENEAEFFKSEDAKARHLNVGLHFIDFDEVRERNPLIDTSHYRSAMFDPNDGHVDPSGVTNAYAKAARDAGAEIYRHTPVTAVRRLPSGEWELTTPGGPLRAEYIVNAAGLWAREVGRLIGVELPVIPMEHQYLVTNDIPAAGRARPGDSGRRRFRRRRLSAPGGPGAAGRHLRAGLPPLGGRWNAAGFRHRAAAAGRRSDRRPARQDDGAHARHEERRRQAHRERRHGVFARRQSHHRPAARPRHGLRRGRLHGGLLAGRRHRSRGRPLDRRRRARAWTCSRWMSAASAISPMRPMCAARRARTISGDSFCRAGTRSSRRRVPCVPPRSTIGSPTRARSSACPPRTRFLSGLPARGQAAHEAPSFYRSSAFEPVAAECRAVREAVGLWETSSYCKLEIAGPGAAAWLDGILANRLPSESGRIALSPMLTPRGRLLGDVTVARIEPDRFLLFGSPSAESLYLRWLRQRSPPATEVSIRSRTRELCGLSVTGPRARELLARVTTGDVSGSGLPFLSSRSLTVGLANTLVLRLSFTGELGYEIYMAPDEQRHVFETPVRGGSRARFAPLRPARAQCAAAREGLRRVGARIFRGCHGRRGRPLPIRPNRQGTISSDARR